MPQYLLFTDPNTLLGVREGALTSAFVTDVELTATGFAGTVNVDWENIDTITP